MLKELSSYDLQAKTFLESAQLKIKVTPYPDEMQSAPSWADDVKPRYSKFAHGTRYRITISGEGKPRYPVLSFDFWGSIADREKNEKAFHKSKPSAYDVLACISSDSYCSDTFSDWCADLGYDTDSRKSLATFKRCRKFAKKINSFFNAGELAALREIN